jgi:flagellar hook-length control protein FliK
MVVNGALPISSAERQSSQHVASASGGENQAVDFAALLFLILGTPQMPGPPVAGDCEPTSIEAGGVDASSACKVAQSVDELSGSNQLAIKVTANLLHQAVNAPLEEIEEPMIAEEALAAAGALTETTPAAAPQETAGSETSQAKQKQSAADQTGRAEDGSSGAAFVVDAKRPQGLFAYGRSEVAAAVSKLAGEQASLRDRRLTQDSQPQAQAEAAGHEGALSETLHLSGESMSANGGPGEQGSFAQQDYREGAHDSVRAPFEALRHDGALIHSSRATEGAPQAAARAIDWRPMIDHLAGEINGRIRIGKSEAVIQLDPPDLGKLQIDLHLDGDKLVARILAEKQESGNLIETHLPELRLALAESRIDQVEVRVDNGSWGGARGDSEQGQRQEAGAGRQAREDSGGVARNNAEPDEPVWRQRTAYGAGRVSMWA